MKQKWICLALAGALALGLAACTPGAVAPADSPAPSRPGSTAAVSAEPSGPELTEPAPELTEPPASEEPGLSSPPWLEAGVLPDREYQPWQLAYMDFLTLLQTQKTTWEPGGEGTQVGSESYSLYDVDKDGVPELFVKFGTCEADFFARCYTLYKDNSGRNVVVMAAQFPFGHSALYTCPDKNGFLQHEGHMGYAELYEYGPLADGELPQGREIFSEEDVWEYTEPGEIVPGAEYIESYYTQLGEYDMYKGYAPESEWSGYDDGRPHPSAGQALLLPVCDWGVGPAPTGNSSEAARTAILAALGGERPLYGASGDHFYGDVGWTTWEEYIQPGGAWPYNDQPLEITHNAWLDMNGDGQEELLLKVVTMRGEDGAGEDGSAPWTSESTVVLSEQEGTVYAYFFGFFDTQDAFYDDGTVGQYGGHYRLSFWKNQCYQYMAPRDPSARPVKWVEGPPLA